MNVIFAVMQIAFLGMAVYYSLNFISAAYENGNYMSAEYYYKIHAFLALIMFSVIFCSTLWINKQYGIKKIIAVGCITAAIITVAAFFLNNLFHCASFNGEFGINEWNLYWHFLKDDFRYIFNDSDMRYSVIFIISAFSDVALPLILRAIDRLPEDIKLFVIEEVEE